MSDDRGTCWSITINNPTEDEVKDGQLLIQLNPGWKCTGQMEVGKDGTPHYQGMLMTNQVRFSAVKKVFTRAHIEKAKNKAALSKYVHKSETRVSEVADAVSNIPTLFEYQHTIAARWDDAEWTKLFRDSDLPVEKTVMTYVDRLVAQDIEAGMCGVEYIAVNPMWRSAWGKFWKQMVSRERKLRQKTDAQDIEDGENIRHAPSESEEDSASPLAEEQD